MTPMNGDEGGRLILDPATGAIVASDDHDDDHDHDHDHDDHH